jgi:hypothetical protein
VVSGRRAGHAAATNDPAPAPISVRADDRKTYASATDVGGQDDRKTHFSATDVGGEQG